MTMQSDILASGVLTTSGQLLDQKGNTIGRARIRAIYIIPSATAGSVVFIDGGSGGTTRLTLNSVASATTPQYFRLNGEGLLFNTNMYATLTNVTSVMVFYS